MIHDRRLLPRATRLLVLTRTHPTLDESPCCHLLQLQAAHYQERSLDEQKKRAQEAALCEREAAESQAASTAAAEAAAALWASPLAVGVGGSPWLCARLGVATPKEPEGT